MPDRGEIALVALLELTVAVRRERRSLAGALSGTEARTHDRLAALEPRSADPAAVQERLNW